jgi:sorbitol-specific phosphotransferase system component IIC
VPIEYDFILKLIDLIRGHAPLWHFSLAAAVFQLCLVMAAIGYRRIWRILRSTGPSAIDTEMLLGKVGYVVMCLLLALMTYSKFGEEAAKAAR